MKLKSQIFFVVPKQTVCFFSKRGLVTLTSPPDFLIKVCMPGQQQGSVCPISQPKLKFIVDSVLRHHPVCVFC